MEKKPIETHVDLNDKETTITIKRNDGRRVSILNVVAALGMVTTNLLEEAERQMNKSNAQFFLTLSDGTLVSAIPFSSHDKNQHKENFNDNNPK